MNGILPLYKPKGMTSHDCVMKIRRLFKMKKVGHTGTLDPGVEGVLPICLGEATKIIPFLQNSKTYVAELCLGTATTTEDSEGEIIEQKEVTSPLTDDEIESVLQKFTGHIKQVPPMYSAVKVDGKKLYEYARENIPVKRPERTVTIHEIKRLEHEETEMNDRFRIEVHCSKGTYIRTLCVDIGASLGYPAHMSYLLRTESDSFRLEETVTFSEIEELLNNGQAVDPLVLPIERALGHLPAYEVTKDVKRRVLHGQKLPAENVHIDDPFKVTYEQQLLAIYERHKENELEIKPIRVFHIHKD